MGSVTGEIKASSYSFTNEATNVPVRLSGNQSFFIVLRNKTNISSRNINEADTHLFAVLKGPYEVSFPAGSGTPERITLDTLGSLTLHHDPGLSSIFPGQQAIQPLLEFPANG